MASSVVTKRVQAAQGPGVNLYFSLLNRLLPAQGQTLNTPIPKGRTGPICEADSFPRNVTHICLRERAVFNQSKSQTKQSQPFLIPQRIQEKEEDLAESHCDSISRTPGVQQEGSKCCLHKQIKAAQGCPVGGSGKAARGPRAYAWLPCCMVGS